MTEPATKPAPAAEQAVPDLTTPDLTTPSQAGRDRAAPERTAPNRAAPERAALDIQGARFTYGRRTVIAGLDLTVEAGTVVGLLGPNGSGKSTLIRGVCRIHRPKAGTFRLGDTDLHRLSPRDLAYVPQGSPGVFSLAVTEAAMLGRTPHSRLRPSPEDERRVHEAIDLLGLAALAQEPTVLPLDEPTSALDLRHQIEPLRLVHTLAEQRDLRVLMAIHDLNLAAHFCHQVALLHEGRIVTSGTPADVYAADLIETVYGLPVDVDLRDGTPEVRAALPIPGRRR